MRIANAFRYRRTFRKTVSQNDSAHAGGQIIDFNAFLVRHTWLLQGKHCDKENAFMQGICVLEVVSKRQWDPHHSRGKKCCRTRKTRRRVISYMGKKLFFALSHVRPCFLREL